MSSTRVLSTRTGAARRHATLLPRTMVGSTLGLVVMGVALTVFAGPLFGLSDRAAQDMLDRAPYIQAVLGEDTVVPPIHAPAVNTAAINTPGGGQ
jgi:multicomponent Na+:H+ antiporter subunit D